jgi:hypothetical protein
MIESIQNLLSDSNVDTFKVPVFQREYSWTKENAEQLFEDVKETGESQRNSLLGLLVLIAPEESPRTRQIVDGQQRLTTITILLSIIRAKIMDNPCSNQRDQIRKFGEISTIGRCLFREGSDSHIRPLLQFEPNTGIHRKYLAGIVTTRYDIEDDKTVSGLTRDETVKLLNHFHTSATTLGAIESWMKDSSIFNQTIAKGLNARKNFEELCLLVDRELVNRTDEEQLNWLIQFSTVLRDRLSIIKYETRSFEDAFVLFETLNDRGMAVAASDLVKNFCLQSDPTNIEQIGNTWTEIFRDLLPSNTVNPIYFLRTYNNSTGDFVTKKDLFRKFKKRIENPTMTASTWIESILLPEAKRFRSLVIDLNSLPQHNNLVNVIFALDSTDSRQWHSIALSSLRLIDHFPASNPVRTKIADFLLIVFNASVILEAKGLRGSLIERPFPAFAVQLHELIQIQSESSLLRELDGLIQRFIEFIENPATGLTTQGLYDILRTKDFPNKTAKTILTTIRLHDLVHGSRMTKLTIEHVCPQKPDLQTLWTNWSASEHEEWVQKLGNLICINTSSNSVASNGGYEAKRQLYVDIQALDMVAQSSRLSFFDVTNWTPEIVAQRTDLIAARLVELLEKRSL